MGWSAFPALLAMDQSVDGLSRLSQVRVVAGTACQWRLRSDLLKPHDGRAEPAMKPVHEEDELRRAGRLLACAE